MKQKGKIVNFIDICRYFPIYSFAEENQKHLIFLQIIKNLKSGKRHSPPEEFAKRKKIILSRQLVCHCLQQNASNSHRTEYPLRSC